MEYRKIISGIRAEYLRGEITFDEAKARVSLVLSEMNERGEKIAKKFGRRYNKLTFTTVFR